MNITYAYLTTCLIKDAKIFADSFGRTLLHEWEPLHTVSLEKLTKYIPLDCTDSKLQTPLHTAVYQGNYFKVRKLLEAGSNPRHCDINGISPFEVAQNDLDMYCVFVDICPFLKTQATKPCVPHDQQHAHFLKHYTTETRIINKLKNQFLRNNQQTSENGFTEHLETAVLISRHTGFKDEFKTLCSTIMSFMQDLSTSIQEDDPMFEFSPILSGSCSEGTKVNAMDEADVLCRFQHSAWEDLVFTFHEEDNYTYLKLESETLDNETHLSVHGLFKRFYGLVRKHIAGVLKNYNSLYIKDIATILPNDRAICPLRLVWSGELLNWQEFSLDVVPTIPVSINKLPGELKHHDLIHDLVIVPKWTSCLIEKTYSNEAFQLGFSCTEKDLFYAMPIGLRQAYKVTKVLLHKCMIIDDIPAGHSLSSYMLKCITFECFTDLPDFRDRLRLCKKRELIDDALQPIEEILQWADKILVKLEQSVVRQQLESFFLKGCNLLGSSMYAQDYRPLLYTRLCRAMLHSPLDNMEPWVQLTQAVAEQLVKSENIQLGVFAKELETLKEMGFDINYRCRSNCTMMYYAIKYDLEECVQMLLEWQASVDNVDGKGRSAMQVARENTQVTLVQVFEAALIGMFFYC